MDEQYYLGTEPAIIIDQEGRAQHADEHAHVHSAEDEVEEESREVPEQVQQQQQQQQHQAQQQQEQHLEEAPEDANDELMGSDGLFSNVSQGLTGHYRDLMMNYWQETINSIETQDHDFKNHQLPLARIKKVMKTDEEVRMISAEAPILFAKGCDIFITELTMRAWIHAEQNKRRTLQKSDIAAALQKSDMFDFLIDVVPREEDKRSAAAAAAASAARTQGSVSESRQGSYVQQQGTTSSSENAAAAANANANANAANAGSSVPGQVPEGQFEAAQYHYNDINYENGRY